MQFSLKYYNPKTLIPAVLVLVFLIDALFMHGIKPLLISIFPGIDVLRVPGNSTLVAIFLGVHDKHLWHLPVFKHLVTVTDMRGRYSGSIKYTWNGEKGEKECKIELSQTASNISVCLYFNNAEDQKSSSKSLVAEVRKENAFFHMYFFYLNSGSVGNDKLDCHEGANTLKYIPSSDDRKAKLIGNYFTNRQIQTRGSIEAFFESETLKGEF